MSGQKSATVRAVVTEQEGREEATIKWTQMPDAQMPRCQTRCVNRGEVDKDWGQVRCACRQSRMTARAARKSGRAQECRTTDQTQRRRTERRELADSQLLRGS